MTDFPSGPSAAPGSVSGMPPTPGPPLEPRSFLPATPLPPAQEQAAFPMFDPADTKISRPHFSIRDLLAESVAGLLARPGRLALTALGTVLGIAALVATIGITDTARGQVSEIFSELDATLVTAAPEGSGGFSFGNSAPSTIPFDAERRLTRINGVVAAGTKSPVDTGADLVRALPVTKSRNGSGFNINVLAGSPGLLDAVKGSLREGRWFDHGHNDRADPVVVLGPAAAARLEITRVDNLPTVFIGERPFSVLGIIDDVAREPDMLAAIIIPDLTAKEQFDLAAPREVVIDTELGAARQVGQAISLTLDPVDFTRIRTRVPPETTVGESIEDSIRSLLLILGGVSLLVGALGIANVTLVSVLERRSEIGLRRSLGAAKRHIASQFLLESTATGLLGGLIGATLGLVTIVLVAAYQDWTPILPTWLPFAAVGLGAIIGLLSGLYPSLRAARIEPIAALRGTG